MDFNDFLKEMGTDVKSSGGFGSVDGDFEDNTYQPKTNMEDLFDALGEEVETQKDHEEVPDHGADGSEGVEGVEGEEGDEGEGDEGVDEDSDSDQSYDDLLLDEWDACIELPDGTQISADELKGLKDFNERVTKFDTDRATYHQREQAIVEAANLGYGSIEAMEGLLIQASQQRQLTQKESIQLELLGSMKNQYLDFNNKLKSTYQDQIQNQIHQQSQVVENNVNALFDSYGDQKFTSEVLPSVNEYLTSKGYDGNDFLKSIAYDPKVFSMLVDASTATRVAKKSASAPKQVVRAMKSKPKQNKEIQIPDGVSSYDMSSYKAFSSLGL